MRGETHTRKWGIKTAGKHSDNKHFQDEGRGDRSSAGSALGSQKSLKGQLQETKMTWHELLYGISWLIVYGDT